MIVKPISHYVKRRNKYGEILEREPSGAPKRSGPREHMVYAVRQDGSQRLKVGQTQNMKCRIQSYESASGVPVKCILQILVDTKDEAKAIEAAALKWMRSQYPAFKREWFACDDDAVVALARHIVNAFGLDAGSVRGLPFADLPEYSVFREHSDDAARGMRMKYRRCNH